MKHDYFLSYAQNNEDVLLWRALGHVQGGFYIDVGANDPVEHSVTKAFYDRGWRGISIEPLPSFHQAFLAQRPRDVNLAVAAGAQDGELTLYDVPDVRGWASPDAAVAEQHRAEGHAIAELTVPVRTLASVCAEHVHGDIHFLKIDVEGFEGEVLRGMDFARWRPWILVIEATLPNSRATNHDSWEPLVTGQGYRYVWFDGLNRYYVAQEHPELVDKFGIQPNVFDAYISHHLDAAWRAGGAAPRPPRPPPPPPPAPRGGGGRGRGPRADALKA
ncbi:FkbM family methyltransferase [Massilia sp. AB1]|uniref:FkbM family methyltransferase n=1 Tax=Massilia sp. AB1 TaxID=2823371 RepID=UPI001E346999|nr:FkbM family methyltransferase [Massilia sp. AB1]